MPPATGTREGVFAPSRWMWGAHVDLPVFLGSALLALGLAALAPWWVEPGQALPVWAFLLFIVAVDVGHVYATLFRTYLDREELQRRPMLYGGVPLVCLVAGVWLYQAGPMWFWRVLAYAAVLHFVRQQVGWVAIYRARLGERAAIDRRIDAAAIYAATGYPLLVWHASPPRAFSWLISGDFFSLPIPPGALDVAGVAYVAIGALYVARAVQGQIAGRRLNLGKHVVVTATFACWYVGIVAYDGDFEFTVTNVLIHGIPYMALLWSYARERGREVPKSLVGRLAAYGVMGFLSVGLLLALIEELAWDRLVWHDHPSLFGGDGGSFWNPSEVAMSLLVPLLALPQATHYVLDAVLWRRRDTGAAQARALGFGQPSGRTESTRSAA